MDLLTIGRNYYIGRKVLLYYNADEDFTTYLQSPDRYKFICIEKGNGIININNKRQILLSPSILCLNEKDSIEIDVNNNLQGKSLYFHPQVINSSLDFENIHTIENLTLTEVQDAAVLNPFIERNKSNSKLLSIGVLAMQNIKNMLKLINHQLNEQDNDHWPCNTRSYFYQLLINIGLLYNNPSKDSDCIINVKSEDADEIILYLHNNLQRKVTIQDITSKFHINRNTLREKFYKATGFSVIDYLNRIRIQMAASLLKDTNLLISDISEKVGFSDITNFGRMFKKHFGCSPREYRNQ